MSPESSLKGHRTKRDAGASPARGRARARAAPLPEDWKPNAEEECFAANLGLNVPMVAAKFSAQQRRRAILSPNWTAEWEYWCLEQVDRDEQADARGNGYVKVIGREGWVSRRNVHDRDEEAGEAVIARLFHGHA